jgi:hypothetical protein
MSCIFRKQLLCSPGNADVLSVLRIHACSCAGPVEADKLRAIENICRDKLSKDLKVRGVQNAHCGKGSTVVLWPGIEHLLTF